MASGEQLKALLKSHADGDDDEFGATGSQRGVANDVGEMRRVLNSFLHPAVGWWKTRQALERYDQTARYALVVSIRAPEVDVDLRTEVANQIGVPVKMET